MLILQNITSSYSNCNIFPSTSYAIRFTLFQYQCKNYYTVNVIKREQSWYVFVIFFFYRGKHIVYGLRHISSNSILYKTKKIHRLLK